MRSPANEWWCREHCCGLASRTLFKLKSHTGSFQINPYFPALIPKHCWRACNIKLMTNTLPKHAVFTYGVLVICPRETLLFILLNCIRMLFILLGVGPQGRNKPTASRGSEYRSRCICWGFNERSEQSNIKHKPIWIFLGWIYKCTFKLRPTRCGSRCQLLWIQTDLR